MAAAQGELAVIDFQDDPPRLQASSGSSLPLRLVTDPGPKGPGVLWGASHHPDGGWNNRGFIRYSWWAWDASGVGHDADQAGWTGSGKWFRPASGWLPFGPYYLRFRMRVKAPLLPRAANGRCDGDTEMKFFLWNNFTPAGIDRVIMMLHAGSEAGRDDRTHTTLDLRAGVSGSYARTTIANQQWVHVQLGWRWGPESAGFQSIWVDNNDVATPTAENRRFADLNAHGLSRTWGSPDGASRLDDQFFLGNIANTGSCVRDDVEIDLMDVELATEFDPSWYPGA